MKKFTFMLLAAFIAVSSWAQPTAVKNHKLLPEQFAAKTATSTKLVPQMKKETAPRQALKGTLKAKPAQRPLKKAKAAPKKAIDLTALLSGKPVDFMVKSYAYSVENTGTEEEPVYDLVPLSIPRVTETWTMTADITTMKVSVTGIGGGETAVEGTVDPTTMSITIPYGQTTGTSDYGTLSLASATGTESLVCTLTSDGSAVVLNDYWFIAILDGNYAGQAYSDIYESTAVIPNGTMTWVDPDGEEVTALVDIDVDEETSTATVWNFGDEELAIDVTLKNGGKFVIKPQLVMESMDFQGKPTGDFYTYNGDCKTPTISGTGTENTLTFASSWTIFAPESSVWFGEQGAATITFDGTFVYPELQETPAIPAAPEVTLFEYWDGEAATVTLTVPCVDVDGGDILSSLLSYQLYTKNEKGEPVELGSPIAYDDKENGAGDQKTVKLGEEAKGLTIIGAKSIYAALGEINESEISWFEFPQVATVPDGVECKEYPATADANSNGTWTTYEATVMVAVDGEDVYIQGIMPQCPNGWAKGTLKNGVVTFPIQCIGLFNGEYMYLSSVNTKTYDLIPVTFNYLADDDMYVSDDLIFANGSPEELGFYYPYFDGMTIGTESTPAPVELPEGAEVVEYPFSGTTFSNGSSSDFESTVNVAVVGDDVYVQGFNEYAPEAWVKGTKDADGNVVFTTGQNLGTFLYQDTEYQFYMVGYDDKASAIADVVMTYNEDQDYYVLQTDVVVSDKRRSISYFKWYEAGSIIGTLKSYDATFNFNNMDVPTSATGVNDGDFKEDQVFTASDITLTITPADSRCNTPNRFWSTSAGPQLRIYSGTMTFDVPDGYYITNIVFNYNSKYWGGSNNAGNVFADTGEITDNANAKQATWTGNAQTVEFAVGYFNEETGKWVSGNSQINSINVTVAIKQLPPMVETVAPDDLESAEWLVEATEIYYYPAEVDEETGEPISEETYEPYDYSAPAQVGFYTVEGEDGTQVYIQGLCPELPEAWVMGTLDADNTVTIPYSTFFGTHEYIDYEAYQYVDVNLFLTSITFDEEENLLLDDVRFVYDPEANTLTSEQDIFVNADRREINYWHWYQGMVLRLMPDVAATPADPEIIEVATVDVKYPVVKFNIPLADVDGNPILASKTSYKVYVKKYNTEELLTLYPEEYTLLEESMDEIPYTFSDNYDIYNNKLYFNQSAAEIGCWEKVGIQTIYRGGDELHESNIVWAENPAFDFSVTVTDMLYATYVAPIDVDFTGAEVTAYAAQVNEALTAVRLIPVTRVPVGEAVIVKAEAAGTYEVARAEGMNELYIPGNNLYPTYAPLEADGSQYVLADGEEGLGFYKARAGSIIPARKGYLYLGEDGGHVKPFYPVEDDDPTAISGIFANEKDEVIFNLAGQRIGKAMNGVNIVNGKKVLK